MTEPNDNDGKLLSIKGLSSQSGISVGTLRRWVRDGRIPCHQPAGRGGKLYFSPDAIQRARSQDITSEASVAAPQPNPGRTPVWMQ